MQKLMCKDIDSHLTSEHYKQLRFTLDEDKYTKIKWDSFIFVALPLRGARVVIPSSSPFV